MSFFADYLKPAAIKLDGDFANRKKVLQSIASLLDNGASGDSDDTSRESEIFKHLLERERLGSTGLGNGIAVPHCRVAGLPEPRAAIIRLKTPIDFDAPDNQPVFLFCALAIDESATDQHLKIFSNLVSVLADKTLITHLKETGDPGEMIATFQNAPS